jgi:hypothetical protein
VLGQFAEHRFVPRRKVTRGGSVAVVAVVADVAIVAAVVVVVVVCGDGIVRDPLVRVSTC